MATTTPEARTETIAAALASENARPDAERLRLPWKDSEYAATVVTIPLSAVVLNPRSHRIRSQLESVAQKDVVPRDPFGEEAQNIIAEILRRTERFDDLKANLKAAGQTDPGVVSHNGLLVNAKPRTPGRHNGACCRSRCCVSGRCRSTTPRYGSLHSNERG
jgi:hypothetical protein